MGRKFIGKPIYFDPYVYPRRMVISLQVEIIICHLNVNLAAFSFRTNLMIRIREIMHFFKLGLCNAGPLTLRWGQVDHKKLNLTISKYSSILIIKLKF